MLDGFRRTDSIYLGRVVSLSRFGQFDISINYGGEWPMDGEFVLTTRISFGFWLRKNKNS